LQKNNENFTTEVKNFLRQMLSDKFRLEPFKMNKKCIDKKLEIGKGGGRTGWMGAL
jgi:hypothetical protein